MPESNVCSIMAIGAFQSFSAKCRIPNKMHNLQARKRASCHGSQQCWLGLMPAALQVCCVPMLTVFLGRHLSRFTGPLVVAISGITCLSHTHAIRNLWDVAGYRVLAYAAGLSTLISGFKNMHEGTQERLWRLRGTCCARYVAWRLSLGAANTRGTVRQTFGTPG